MSNGYLGEIRTFGFAFAPRNFMMCNGQTLGIQQYTALYALIGTYYGGNGQTSFMLPDLRGRVPIHQGQGAGQPAYTVGQNGGAASLALTTANLPAHTHAFTNTSSLTAIQTKGTDQAPAAGSLFARGFDPNGVALPQIYVPAGTTGTQVALGGVNIAGSNSLTGSNTPFDNRPPYLTLNVCIQVAGLFPSRN